LTGAIALALTATIVFAFDLEGHRGARGLSPENTLAAFKRALAIGVTTIETENSDNVQPIADRPSAWTSGLDLRSYEGSVPRLAHAAGCTIWSPLARNVSAARIAETHALGMTVLPWTVNDPAEMRRLIDAGVDGIITDYPDRLRRVMADKHLALP
jgi:glycerophosphoryl diester phosphodiesterase